MSTIYLAAAVRDVGIDAGEDGLVIGTQHEPGKVKIAEKNLADAGVDEHAEILAGDLLETLPPRLAALADLDRPVDFVLMDIRIPMALPALELLIPHLRPRSAGGLRQRGLGSIRLRRVPGPGTQLR